MYFVTTNSRKFHRTEIMNFRLHNSKINYKFTVIPRVESKEYFLIVCTYEIFVTKAMASYSCNNKCKTHEQVTKYMVYELGGCYCRNCEYYFKEKFLRCPCCNVQVRYSTRSNRRRLESEVARI